MTGSGQSPTQGFEGDGHRHAAWFAGGGIKGGVTYGFTDELGLEAVRNQVTIHDLHATILHQLGIDHAAYKTGRSS